MIRKYAFFFLILPLFLFIPGCRQEKVPEAYKPSNAHEAYLHSLYQANLAETALGQDWISAAKKALQEPIDVSLPFEEVFYVDPSEAMAVAYRFDVKRGQRVELDVFYAGQRPCRLFIDGYRVRGESEQDWLHVASANESEKRLSYEPRQDAQYVIRLQPELLRGGEFRITLRKAASLEFPVFGKDCGAIQSGFGAPRDGGQRTHHGVDIFAKRHTPILAPSDAYVEHVGESEVGGRTIWLYDSKRRIYQYFAHLQTQEVQLNEHVKAGQQIGTVGNTGNARTTPPHLHFGIYASGPVDPEPFITKINNVPKPVSADLSVLGTWVRSKNRDASLRISADGHSERITSLDKDLPMRIVAAASVWYRVLLPDGTSGYIYEQNVEAADDYLERHEVFLAQAVSEAPFFNAAIKERLEAGDIYFVLGLYKGYWLIRTQQGQTGWTPIPTLPADNL
ncbi:MAG: peptidoglycan DD-metalloendopeptidase family protein [Candidatus Aminicenantes bacterium]|jgi:murein DD-endopeptidase MepM/ murein hydrolase activator NlpD/SH3-like domain-containing protein